MNWDYSPATLEALATAVAALFAILAFAIAVFSLRASNRQTLTLEAEVSDRMRPWVGLFEFEVAGDANDEPVLKVLVRNFGPLPAQRARLGLAIEPLSPIEGQHTDPNPHQEAGHKVLMPQEDGNYRIPLLSFRQAEEWIAAKRDLLVTGKFVYALGQRSFESEFEAKLWFSRPRPPGGAVDTNWRNTAAT